MIVLRHAKFISGSRVYKVGEILPDTAGTRELVARGFAEEVNTAKSSKPAKKKEQPVQPVVTQSQPEPVTQIVQDTQQNAQVNS
ncbi:MAG: hypothetical protein IJQ56_10065 [Synergistaceae bacterium]|nr:hypothetical protein [Synergistaceae bacterium]